MASASRFRGIRIVVGERAVTITSPSPEFAAALDRISKRLDAVEWHKRSQREALALLGILKPRLSDQFAEILRVVLLHQSGEPQIELLARYDAEVLDPMYRNGWRTVPNWQYTLDSNVIVLLTALAKPSELVGREERGTVVTNLARLGVPESDMMVALEAIHPDVKGDVSGHSRGTLT